MALFKTRVLRLSEFLAHFARAGAEAAYSAAEESKEYLMAMFHEDEEGTLTPKMVNVNIAGEVIETPLITLTPAANVSFEDMSLGFRASLDIEKDGTAVMNNHKDLLKRSVDVDVKMRFRSKEPPEGIELLRERLNQQLSQDLKPIERMNENQEE